MIADGQFIVRGVLLCVDGSLQKMIKLFRSVDVIHDK